MPWIHPTPFRGPPHADWNLEWFSGCHSRSSSLLTGARPTLLITGRRSHAGLSAENATLWPHPVPCQADAAKCEMEESSTHPASAGFPPSSHSLSLSTAVPTYLSPEVQGQPPAAAPPYRQATAALQWTRWLR